MSVLYELKSNIFYGNYVEKNATCWRSRPIYRQPYYSSQISLWVTPEENCGKRKLAKRKTRKTINVVLGNNYLILRQ